MNLVKAKILSFGKDLKLWLKVKIRLELLHDA